jgi:hypothetical protein
MLPVPVAHWPLETDARDHAGPHDGDATAVRFAPVAGRGAAAFDGITSRIVVPDDAWLRLGARPFSVSFWLRLPEQVTGVFGDCLSKFDAARRRGLTCRAGGSSPGYSSVADVRSLHAGIDDGLLGEWTDHGKPWPSNTLVSTLTVFDGRLYTGIADALPGEAAPAVFRHGGGSDWEYCGRLDVDPRTRSVMSLIVHQGALYAGTGTWDWDKSMAGHCGPTHVFRWEGGTSWQDCGVFGQGVRVLSLASFDGRLYAGDDRGMVHRMDAEGTWSCCGQLGAHDRVNALMVHQGRLYGAPHGAIFRYDGGARWTCVGGAPDRRDGLFGENQTHTLQVYQGHLWAGMWPQGKVLRYEGGPGEWTDTGQLGIATDVYRINEVNDLTVYNGKLYTGALPLGEVYRYEQDGEWTGVGRLVHNEQMNPTDIFSWNRVPCMAVFQGRLFAGTSTCHGIASAAPHPGVGRVWSVEAGRNACFDGDLGSRWRHVAVVRGAERLTIYVDGAAAASSAPWGGQCLDLATTEPLVIGAGAQGTLHGWMADVRLYDSALGEKEIIELAAD